MVDYVLLEKYTKNISVLFVEDDESIRKEITLLLKDIFSLVHVKENGHLGKEQYLSYFKNNESYYDLVITDIKMPEMNGIELCTEIYHFNKAQKIIVLSAHDESKYLIPLVNMGLSHYIKKPLEINNFISVIYELSKSIFEEKSQTKENNTEESKLSNNIIWNKKEKLLYKHKKIIKLTKKEKLFLELLLKENNSTHSPEELLNHLWKEDENSVPNILNLNNIIARLRKKIPEIKIENVYALGYKIQIL